MCKFIEVSRSGYYEWLAKQSRIVDENRPGSRAQEDMELTELIKSIFLQNRCTYGTRRIKRMLARLDGTQESINSNSNISLNVSRRRIGRLMFEAGLVCKTKKRFRAVNYSKHNKPVAPNLLNREFGVIQPNCCWVGDMTYIPTREGWLYLATVIDLYSRKIIGWSMDDNMQSKLVNDAILMAIRNRSLQLLNTSANAKELKTEGLIWHTDQGSQYASDSHRSLLKDFGIIQSMSRKGNCWDNAVAESFFHTIKTELINHCRFKTREEAKSEIFEYIEVFYNRIRIHSTNDYLSPIEFEAMDGYM